MLKILSIFLVLSFHLYGGAIFVKDDKNMDLVLPLVSAISESVHLLQQERGASCGYISSHGKKFKKKLLSIREISDAKLQTLSNILLGDKRYVKYLSDEDSKHLLKKIKSLEQLRKDILNQKIGFSKTFSKYTQIIAFLLLKISDISDNIENKNISDKLYTYTNMLMYKESIGQKRAALSALFSQKKPDKEIFEYFLTSDTQERIYQKNFLRFLSDTQKTDFYEISDNKIFAQVKEYEAKALQKMQGMDVDANPEKWFELCTQKINLIQNLEHELFEDLLVSIENINMQKATLVVESTHTNSSNISTLLEEITPIVVLPIYNLDTEGLPALLRPLLKNNQELKALEITESLDNETVFSFYRNNDELIINKPIPQDYLKYKYKIKNIIYDGEIIGEIKAYYSQSSQDIGLTQNELKWIGTHRIKVGVEQWAPIVFSNNGKDIDGISGDFLKKIVSLTGLEVVIVNDKWEKLLNSFKEKKIDLLPATYYTDERAKYGLYTSGYFKMKDYIYIKENTQGITSLKDLKGKKLAIIKGYGTIDKIKQKYPQIELVYTQDLDDSLNKLLQGEVDALYEGGIAVEKKINDELITGLVGVPVVSFKAPDLHFFSQVDEPLLNSILQKALNHISLKEKKEIIEKWFIEPILEKEPTTQELPKVSFIGMLSTEELLVALLLFLIIGYIVFLQYKRGNVLNVNLKKFNLFIIIFELVVIFFLIYELMVLDRTENRLAKAYEDQLYMLNVVDQLRQSSDDLTSFARNYAVTGNEKFKKQYFDVLAIRNGTKARPQNYDAIYWNLDTTVRKARHPKGERQSLSNIMKLYPFTYSEKEKLEMSHKNSDALADLEKKSFLAVKAKNNELAVKLLYSNDYEREKSKIMLPLDELIFMLKERTNFEIKLLDQKIKVQFRYILALALLFIIGNIFIYILLNEKINKPIEYLTNVIRMFQSNKKDIEEKNFYNDEIGVMNREFFAMRRLIDKQTKDLTKQLEIVKTAERKQNELIKVVEEQKSFVQTLLDSQEQLIVTTDGTKIISGNATFLDFFAVKSTQEFQTRYDASCICKMFNTNAPEGYIQIETEEQNWIEYIISHPNQIHKAMITREEKDYIFSVTAANLPGDKGLKSAVFTDITEMERAKEEIEAVHKHTKDSIEYASLIQHSLIPERALFDSYFKESFSIWHPKDVVGGDIYLMENISEDEVVLMVIDCTGHGVPGAFVTMLVKAIERQILANIHRDEDVSPAKMLRIFNKSIKHLLKQEDGDSISNAGFDGGILYYNKKQKIIRYAGAETPAFYYQDSKMHKLKGDRHSIGYKKSDASFEFSEYEIDVSKETRFYIATDGYFDQCGGAKSFPFGKKRFLKLLEESMEDSLADQQELLLYELQKYQANNERNDDITVIGLKI